MPNRALMTREALVALDNAIQTWAASTTDPSSPRRHDLERDKQRIVQDYIIYVNKHPIDASPSDVLAWRLELERRGLKEATVYAMISKVSSFYKWAMSSPVTRQLFRHNPVDLARPKPPKPYRTSKALDEEQRKKLVSVVKAKADAGDIIAKRDLALLLFYFETGMRREEIIRLRWKDTKQGRKSTITTRVKGGNIRTKEVNDERCWDALFDYLEASGRLWSIGGDHPLWARHDSNADGEHDPLSSRGFVKNLKKYAEEAGLDVHLHQTRHTHAQIVADGEGMKAAQESLGHENERTTKEYVPSVSTWRDKYGSSVLDEVL